MNIKNLLKNLFVFLILPLGFFYYGYVSLKHLYNIDNLKLALFFILILLFIFFFRIALPALYDLLTVRGSIFLHKDIIRIRDRMVEDFNSEKMQFVEKFSTLIGIGFIAITFVITALVMFFSTFIVFSFLTIFGMDAASFGVFVPYLTYGLFAAIFAIRLSSQWDFNRHLGFERDIFFLIFTIIFIGLINWAFRFDDPTLNSIMASSWDFFQPSRIISLFVLWLFFEYSIFVYSRWKKKRL